MSKPLCNRITKRYSEAFKRRWSVKLNPGYTHQSSATAYRIGSNSTIRNSKRVRPRPTGRFKRIGASTP